MSQKAKELEQSEKLESWRQKLWTLSPGPMDPRLAVNREKSHPVSHLLQTHHWEHSEKGRTCQRC